MWYTVGVVCTTLVSQREDLHIVFPACVKIRMLFFSPSGMPLDTPSELRVKIL